MVLVGKGRWTKEQCCALNTEKAAPHFRLSCVTHILLVGSRTFAQDDRSIPRLEDDYWAYERGRLFGAIAPLSMPLFKGKSLNPKAVSIM